MEEKRSEFKASVGVNIYLLSIIGIIFLQLVFGVIFEIVSPEAGSRQDYIIRYLASIFFQLGCLSIYILYLKKKRTTPSINLKFKIKPIFYVAGVFGGLMCLFFFYPIAQVFDNLFNNLGLESQESFKVLNGFENGLLIFTTVILAPICEELIYRSAFLSGLNIQISTKRNEFIKHNICAILCGLAFSLMHMNYRQTVYQFFLGYACALLSLSCKSIIPSILTHLVSNLIAIMSGFFKAINTPFEWFEGLLNDHSLIVIIISIVFIALGVCAFMTLYSVLKRYATSNADNINTITPKNQNENPKENPNQNLNENPKDNPQKNQNLNENEKLKNKNFYLTFIFGLSICLVIFLTVLIDAIN